VLEYYSGGSISGLLKEIVEGKRKEFTTKDSFNMYYQAAAGLNHLHEKNIIHRGN
jgi:serine/threonine protein kinase